MKTVAILLLISAVAFAATTPFALVRYSGKTQFYTVEVFKGYVKPEFILYQSPNRVPEVVRQLPNGDVAIGIMEDKGNHNEMVVEIWDLQTKTMKKRLDPYTEHSDFWLELLPLPNNKLLGRTHLGVPIIWDLGDGSYQVLEGSFVAIWVVYDANQDKILIVEQQTDTMNLVLSVLNSQTFEQEKQLDLSGENYNIYSCDVMPNGNIVVYCSSNNDGENDEFRIYDPQLQNIVKTITTGHSAEWGLMSAISDSEIAFLGIQMGLSEPNHYFGQFVDTKDETSVELFTDEDKRFFGAVYPCAPPLGQNPPVFAFRHWYSNPILSRVHIYEKGTFQIKKHTFNGFWMTPLTL